MTIRRTYIIIVFFILSIVITIFGALTPLSTDQAQQINQEMENLINILSDVGVLSKTTYIFGNNFMLCLSFFTPFVGPLIGVFVLYNTGVVIAAQSMSLGVSPTLTFMLLLIFPFAWMEFMAYSVAMTQSLWLTMWILKRQLRKGREIVDTCIMISICAVVLLAAAFIETMFLELFKTSI
ncbi:MAG: stage II sporulation protein M [Candidatus Bathyarchaeia archaeon]